MFKEDMISDGLENCIEYVTNFDPQRVQILLHTLPKLFTLLF